MNTATDSMSPAQINYCIARAAYEAALSEMASRIQPPGDGASEEEIDAWLDAEEEVRDALGMDDLFAQLRAAEDAMLAWSFAVARRTAGRRKNQLAAIAEVEAAAATYGHARTRALDLALRLAA